MHWSHEKTKIAEPNAFLIKLTIFLTFKIVVQLDGK